MAWISKWLSLAKIPSAEQVVDLSLLIRRNPSSMIITLLLHVLRLVPFLCGGHHQLALENLALRQQLAVYRRTVSRPRLCTMDRLWWVGLARVWADRASASVIREFRLGL